MVREFLLTHRKNPVPLVVVLAIFDFLNARIKPFRFFGEMRTLRTADIERH